MQDCKKRPKKTLVFHCASGISGDMLAGALLDLGADEGILRQTLESLPLEGYRIEISRVVKSGLDACDFNVILDKEHENHDHDMAYLHPDRYAPDSVAGHVHEVHAHVEDSSHEHAHEGHVHEDSSHEHAHEGHVHEDSSHEHANEGHVHEGHVHDADDHHDHFHDEDALHDHFHDEDAHHDHSHETDDHPHHHHHHGRNLEDITRILSAGKLTEHALNLALRIFQIVAEAESKAHGLPVEKVHFHEVGAVDSIVDIAAISICIDQLGVTDCIFTDLTEGTGTVRCQHGILPIPVPATTQILARYRIPFHIDQRIRGELITPTGAAAAAALRTRDRLPDRFTILSSGLGAGKRAYETAGVVRSMLIEEESGEDDAILVMQTNLDDCSGEALGYTLEKLLDAGALDAYYTPIYMKKHRPAYLLTVLAQQGDRGKLEQIIFSNTTTIGLRYFPVERTKLSREMISIETPWGPADIKCCRLGKETLCYPEYASVAGICDAQGGGYMQMYNRIRAYAQEHLQTQEQL